MEYIKKEVELGHLQLARLNQKNQPVPINYADLQSTQKTRNNYTQILQKLKELSEEQKSQWVTFKKLHANQVFKTKKWQQAIEIYLEAMLGINIQQKDPQKLKLINMTQKYPIMLNIVACNYHLKNYKVGIDLCDKILTEQSGKNHIKTLYKKCYCLIGLGQLQKAKQTTHLLQSAVKDQSSKAQIEKKKDIKLQDVNQILKQIKNKMIKEKEVYKRFFVNKQDQEEQQTLISSSQSQTEQILIYKENPYEKFTYFGRKIYKYIQDCFMARHIKFQ